MPSYLPPVSQRPQMISRLELSESKNGIGQLPQSETENGVISAKGQYVERGSESSKARFPHESEVSRFRGDIGGRSLMQGANPEQLSGLSDRVTAFDRFRPIGPRLSSLGGLESVALGLKEPPSNTEPVETEEGTNTEKEVTEGSSKEKVSESPEHQKPSGESLSAEEIKEVDRLKRRDAEVKQHEQAHVSAGGQHIRGGISYDYTQGPNGKRYVTSGQVNIDLSPEASPQATISKMQQVKRAALAPAQPSGADRAVAAAAAQNEREARAQLAKQQSEELSEANAKSRPQAQKKVKVEASNEPVDQIEVSEAPQVQAEAPKTKSAPEQRSLQTHESHPLSSGHESHPLSSGLESYPLSSGLESHPLSSGHESHPLSSGLESYPLSSGHESHPLSSGLESYPLSSGHESHPLSSGHESYPLSSNQKSPS